mgnify:CR=1 FL=1
MVLTVYYYSVVIKRKVDLWMMGFMSWSLAWYPVSLHHFTAEGLSCHLPYVLFFDISRLSHAVWGRGEGEFIICRIISTISNYVVSVCLLLQLCRDWYGIWEQWTLRPEDIPSVEDTKAYQIPACSTETVCGDGSHLGQRSLVLRPSATIYVYIQVFGFIHINVILI